MTTDLIDGDSSMPTLPSVKDVLSALMRVRQFEGISIGRIEKYGDCLQQLSISQDEFRRSGSEEGTLSSATITALKCAVDTHPPESVQFKVLSMTLNFKGLIDNLTQRQNDVMTAIGVLSGTSFKSIEKEIYKHFAYVVCQQERSFCSRGYNAETIAKLPYEARVCVIDYLLRIVSSTTGATRDLALVDFMRALPALATVFAKRDPKIASDSKRMYDISVYALCTTQYAEWVNSYLDEIDSTATFLPGTYLYRVLAIDAGDSSEFYDKLASTIDSSLADIDILPPGIPDRASEYVNKGIGVFFDKKNGRADPTFFEALARSVRLLAQVLLDNEESGTWEQSLIARASAAEEGSSATNVRIKADEKIREINLKFEAGE